MSKREDSFLIEDIAAAIALLNTLKPLRTQTTLKTKKQGMLWKGTLK